MLVFDFFVMQANWCNARDCFLLSDGETILEEGLYDGRYPSCSTFKIATALMGFDAGILQDATHPLLNYHSTDVDWLDVWKKPHHPSSWFTNSCAWYSQRVTAKLGKSRFDDYVQLLDYGNQDTRGDLGMNNGWSHCWLSSSLTISPKE